MPLAEAARLYSELGWALVPLHGKMPLGKGWEKNKPRPPDFAAGYWETLEDRNMGLVLGPSGVIDFELDAGDDGLYWSLVGGDWPDTPSFFTGARKPHILFRDPGGLSRKTRDGLELRAGPHQSVIPPSIHPDTGEPYTWRNDPSEYPLADPPQALLDFFASSTGGVGDSHWRQPLVSGKKLGEGEGRHASMVSFLGKAARLFDTPEMTVAAALVYASETQDPPYPDEVVTKQALDIWARYREEEEHTALDEAGEYLKIRRLDKIEMKSVKFVWRPFLQRSAFHLLVGRKGAGKGSLLTYLAANMTQGQLEDEARSVLWIKTEDSFEIDVKPRFVAQGGDPRRFLAVHKHVHLPDDLPHIRAVAQEYGVGMVVIDPIVGVIRGANTDSEGPIVDAIGGLNEIAHDLDLMVIGVRHLGKNPDRDVLERVLGSAAWVNTPRAVLGIAQDEDTKRVTLQVLAGNRVRGKASYDFSLEEAKVEGLEEPVSKLVPIGESDTQVGEIILRRDRTPQHPAVKEWILELIQEDVPLAKENLAEECIQKFGVGMGTLDKVCKELKEEGKLRYLPRAKDEHGQFLPGTKWYFVRP